MHTSELLKHIYDINLSYLLLAQRLIVQDKASAMFRLGINEEMATTLAALTLPQMVKLAETNQLVCHFRFDSHIFAFFFRHGIRKLYGRHIGI